jgi:hypothetical protein
VEQIHTLIKMTDTLAERTLKLLQKKWSSQLAVR